MSNVELGVVREIWLAPPDDHAGNKNSFLVRNDSYVVQEAGFGRQIRLGSPVDLGPDSSWNQDGWFGGAEQERWFDKFMYDEGSADTTDRLGRIRLWGGFRHLMGVKTRPGAYPAVMAPGGTGGGEWDTPLVVGERHNPLDDPLASAIPAESDHKLYSAVSGGANAAVASFTYGIRAIGASGNELGSPVGQFLVGTADGRLWKYDQSTNAVTEDPDSPGFGVTQFDNQIGIDCIKGYNGATYYGRGRSFYRRYWEGSGNPVHTLVTHVGQADELRSLVIWQNRMWFLGWANGGQTTLYTSDGVTVVAVMEMPPGFVGYCMVPHYGSLYIGGAVNMTPGGEDPGGQVWRYNGISLTKLWDSDDVERPGGLGVRSLASWDRFVAWPRNGTAADPRAGVWLYDAEEDAILEGPSIDLDPAASEYEVTQVCTWSNSLAVAFRDRRTITASTYDWPWAVMFLRRDGSVRMKENTLSADFAGQSLGYGPTNITRSVKSSAFDMDLLGVEKIWLTGWVRCKVPQNSQVRVTVSVDGEAEVAVKTVTYDAVAGENWRNIRFPVVDANGVNLRGEQLQYTVYVENTDSANVDSTANPEVGLVAFQFRVAPEKRRMWHVRVHSTDGQERLDGTANPLATRDAIVAKLLELWRSNDTLDFWEASADSTDTGTEGDEVKVTMSSFTDQPYRVSSDSTEVASETSFTLLEVLE